MNAPWLKQVEDGSSEPRLAQGAKTGALKSAGDKVFKSCGLSGRRTK